MLSCEFKEGIKAVFLAANKTSWASDGLKFWLFENVSPNENLAVIFDLGL